MNLKSATLKETVMWGGHSTGQILAAAGTTLELNEKLRVIIATPSPTLTNGKVKMIPLENVKEFEKASDAEVAAQVEAAKELLARKAESDRITAAKAMAKKSLLGVKPDQSAAEAVAELRGATKFEKDPVTGLIVEKQV